MLAQLAPALLARALSGGAAILRSAGAAAASSSSASAAASAAAASSPPPPPGARAQHTQTPPQQPQHQQPQHQQRQQQQQQQQRRAMAHASAAPASPPPQLGGYMFTGRGAFVGDPSPGASATKYLVTGACGQIGAPGEERGGLRRWGGGPWEGGRRGCPLPPLQAAKTAGRRNKSKRPRAKKPRERTRSGADGTRPRRTRMPNGRNPSTSNKQAPSSSPSCARASARTT